MASRGASCVVVQARQAVTCHASQIALFFACGCVRACKPECVLASACKCERASVHFGACISVHARACGESGGPRRRGGGRGEAGEERELREGERKRGRKGAGGREGRGEGARGRSCVCARACHKSTQRRYLT